MNDFWDAIKLSLRYKWSITGAIASSAMIAILFGASIATVLPFVRIVFSDDACTVETWLDQQITLSQANGLAMEQELEQLLSTPAPAGEVRDLKRDLASNEFTTQRYQWVRQLVDGRTPTTAFGTLQLLIVWLLIASILKGFFLVASVMLVSRIANGTVMDMRRIYFSRALEMDARRVENLGTNVLMTHLSNSMQLVSAGLMGLYGRAIREPLKMLTCLAMAAYISWPLLLLSLAVMPFGGALVRYLSQRMKRAVSKEIGGMSAVFQTLMETFNGLKTVRIFNRERTERVRFKKDARTLYRISMRISLYDSLIRPATEMAGIASFSIAVLAGGYLVLNRETHLMGIPISREPMTADQVVWFFVMLAGAADPARKLSEIVNVLVRGGQACQILKRTFNNPPQVAAPAEPTPVPVHRESIRFNNVRYAYQPNTPVLKGVTLEIPYQQTLAIVGGNGCGKSTLICLLARFYDPNHGTIEVDGVNLRDLDPKKLREQFAWVTQDAALFQGSIYDNIAYGKQKATDFEIQSAAKMAGVTDFLDRISDGLNTDVGDMGRNLSAGQRQRVALARAIVADPRVLILDEATSQMDGYNEQLIHQRLKPFLQQRTTIMISHRRSSLELADRIIVMDSGSIIEDGSLEELTTHSSNFQELFHRSDAA